MAATASAKIIDVPMGLARFSGTAGDVLQARGVGNGLAVTLYDPELPLAAMMHLLLPDSSQDKIGRDQLAFRPYKYVDTAVPLVLHRFWDAGGDPERMRVGVFGGAELSNESPGAGFGFRNFTELRYVLWNMKVRIDVEHTHGRINRSVRLDVDTGRIELVMPDGGVETFEQGEEVWS